MVVEAVMVHSSNSQSGDGIVGKRCLLVPIWISIVRDSSVRSLHPQIYCLDLDCSRSNTHWFRDPPQQHLQT